MTNIDLKKTYAAHYRATAAPSVVDVPQRPFLMIDGAGDPNTAPEYVDAMEALYPIAYGLRAAVKAATGDTYVVMPLHVGAYAEEASTIAKLHTFIAERGGTLVGKHHEIYLSDPRKTAPEKLRTIIRQPFIDA